MSEPVEKKAKTVEEKNESQKKLLIGSRKSNLAMWQANHVNDELNRRYPKMFEVIGISTLGDKDQMKPLADFAQKGVFTKELDVALLSKDIDLAVHCIKDLPTELVPGLAVGAVMARGDQEDCVIFNAKHKSRQLKDLPTGSVIGTSALRRTAFIQREHPHLTCKNIRGNVNTRLAKLDNGDFDAIILAAVGLQRLGMQDRIHQTLSKDIFGYAVGQGALAVVIREGDKEMETRLQDLVCHTTTLQCHAERTFLNTLNGGCKVPIAVRCSIQQEAKEEKITLWAAVASPDGATVIEHTDSLLYGKKEERVKESKQLGRSVGLHLLSMGAAKMLEGIVQPTG